VIELRGLQGLRGFAERLACEESGFTRKSRKWVSGPAVGLKQTPQTTQTTQTPSDDAPDVEADKRLAIQVVEYGRSNGRNPPHDKGSKP